jgi:hypothetical protein
MLYAQGWDEARLRKCLRRKEPAELAGFILARHQERFFEPLTKLRESSGNSQGYGFSILAICSLLVETIQSYRDGLPTTDKREYLHLSNLKNIPSRYHLNPNKWTSGAKAFRRFFESNRNIFLGIPSTSFYKKIRCGILHQGQTKHGWIVKQKGASVWGCMAHANILHRDNFVKALNQSFQKYIDQVSVSKWESKICRNAAKKVWWLMKLS